MEGGDELPGLLREARNGSATALGAALQAYRNYLLLVANKEIDPRLSAKGGASDIVQQTCLEAQQGFAGFRGESEAEWLAWLRTLLNNNVANFRRHWETTAKRRASREVAIGGDSTAPGMQLGADTPTPSREMMAVERAAAVRAAMDRLPEDYRTILTLRYIEALPFEDAARRMGRTSAAARKLWARAVERLEQELGEPP